MSQKYEKLKTLLKELFQLDQPDLDFGFYRVMHAEVSNRTTWCSTSGSRSKAIPARTASLT